MRFPGHQRRSRYFQGTGFRFMQMSATDKRSLESYLEEQEARQQRPRERAAIPPSLYLGLAPAF